MNKVLCYNQENTCHQTCSRLTEILVAHNVKYAVCCPGSRNAPLLMAFARCKKISKVVIADERTAGYVAVGLAQQTRCAVAIVCTSGTALLNLAPAVAEAYYAELPLIVISADRPKEWIDQNDSQTMRQPDALASFTKWRCSLPSQPIGEMQSWWANRMLNEALATAENEPYAPIHLNIHIGEPICGTTTEHSGFTEIHHTPTIPQLSGKIYAELNAEICSAHKVMVVCGFMPPNDQLSQALGKLTERKNVVVLSEQLANVSASGIITQVDTMLSEIPIDKRKKYAPDLLIYVGGAIVSKNLKNFLRKYADCKQWRVGADRCIIDTFMHCRRTIGVTAEAFFSEIAKQKSTVQNNSDYSQMWKSLSIKANISHLNYISSAPWCSLSAMAKIKNAIPPETILHLSNGLSVRLAQLFAMPQASEWWSNRGVSGIDGCTSTALGASIASNGKNVLLITGDMSFGYDINGLCAQYSSPNFKIIVMCNSGGGIFRFINGTSSLPELEEYFEVKHDIPVGKYATAFGYKFYSAKSASELDAVLPLFFSDSNPSILAINTDSPTDATVLRGYYHRNHTKNKS